MDTTKAVSVQTGLPMVSIPTTYAGAEWTPFFGVRNEQTRTKDAGFDARVEGIVYEPELTLRMPAQVTAGTALNALTHCAEALYVPGRTDESDEHALQGAALIARHLPAVLDDGSATSTARTGLLEGAMHGGAALRVGMGLGHAMAQSLGGRYGVPHGAMNAICLPPALRFNADVAGDEIARLAEAMGAEDPAARTEELAAIALDTRLRDYDIPRDDLGELSAATAERGAAKANPRVGHRRRDPPALRRRLVASDAARPGPRRVRRKGRAHPGAVVVASHPSFRPAPADHGRSGKEAAVSSPSLPPAPSLEQLRKQAKDLLRAHRAGDPQAVARVAAHEPGEPLKLTGAQHVVAREHGFPSWPRLKAYVERVAAHGPDLQHAYHEDLDYYEGRAYGLHASAPRRHRERRRRLRALRRPGDRGGRARRGRAPARLRELGGAAPPRRGPARLGRALRPRLPRRRGP